MQQQKEMSPDSIKVKLNCKIPTDKLLRVYTV